MPSLSDKLKSMGVRLGIGDTKPKAIGKSIPIDKIIPGKYESTEFGDIFVYENFYPLDHIHGNLNLAVDFDPERIFEWAKIQNGVLKNPPDEIFLDTETTGLAGGTGTFAFMVGVGRFTETGFQTSQLFMRDPGDEKAMLAYLEKYIAGHALLVSFNGKSFDIPILKTRYELNLIPNPFTQFGHIDVLHLARKIWRMRLENRSLKDLENHILEFQRAEEEIPGWLVPQLYVDYLHSQDATPLKGVFYHNEMDVVSLAVLYKHLAKFMSDPFSLEKLEGLDVVALAKLDEEFGRFEDALHLYQSGIEAGLPDMHYASTFSRYGHIFRQQQNWQMAIQAWEKAVEYGHIESAIDLAKTYEHKMVDLSTAQMWTIKCIQMVEHSTLRKYQKRELSQQLEKRLKRINLKITSLKE